MKKNVLIVEDEVMIANVIQMYIKSAYYTCVGIAIDYEEALAILEQENIDIALLDVNISGNQTGTDLAHYINKHYNIPIIFLTAYSDRNTIEEIKTTLPFGYLKKPIDKENLLILMEIAISNFTKKQKTTNEKITLKIGKETHQFNAQDLLYVEANHVYVLLVMSTSKNLFVRSSLIAILELLPTYLLKQVNRSQAINPSHIEKIVGNKVFLGDQTFKISSNFMNNFEI